MHDAAFASLGRKALELELLNAQYDTLLGALSRVASGEVKPERVTVDLKARTWAIADARETVATREDADAG